MVNHPALEVIKPGIHSLIQDLGRYGSQHLGITPGGPADLHAYLWANKILNNDSQMACIEVHFGLITLRVLINTKIALCGAEFDVKINGQSALNWQTHTVNINNIIQYSAAKKGKCGYLAISGGLQTPAILGSRSTVIRDALSDITSTPLQTGQILPTTDNNTHLYPHNQQACYRVPRHYIPDYSAPLTLALFPCYQWSQLTLKQQTQLLTTKYQISAQSNRMGYRLTGKALTHLPTTLVSEGIALGSVQLPPDGQPIILLQDRQTIGGYPKAGLILPLDCSKLSQRQQGTYVNFKQAEALIHGQKMQAFMRFFNL